MKRFSLDEGTLILVVILVLLCIVCFVVLMDVGSSSGQVAPTWTPRPTGAPVTLTCEVFLPLVEKSATPTR